MDKNGITDIFELIDEQYLEEAAPPALPSVTDRQGTGKGMLFAQADAPLSDENCPPRPQQTRQVRAVTAKRRAVSLFAAAAACLLLAGGLWVAARFGVFGKDRKTEPLEDSPLAVPDALIPEEKTMELQRTEIWADNGTLRNGKPQTVLVPWAEYPMLTPEELPSATASAPPEKEQYEFSNAYDSLPSDTFAQADFLQARLICDEPSWEVEETEFVIHGFLPLPDGVLIYGSNQARPEEQDSSAWLQVYSRYGELRWTRQLSGTFRSEQILNVFQRGDGSIAVIGTGDQERLCFTLLSSDGEILLRRTDDPIDKPIKQAIEFGDGYLLRMGWADWSEQKESQLLRLNGEGEIVESFALDLQDQHVILTDMLEYQGKLWLYGILEAKDRRLWTEEPPYKRYKTVYGDEAAQRRHDIINDMGSEEYPLSEEQAELLNSQMRQAYSVILLCADRELCFQRCWTVRGAIGQPYSLIMYVGGSLQSGLGIRASDGALCWEFGCIDSTAYYPSAGSFTYVLRYSLCRCTLTEDGSAKIERIDSNAQKRLTRALIN